MTTYYRKNFSAGVMSLALKDSPDYTDDPRFDEIAVEEGHTLPDSDDTTLTKQFRLVIWSGDYTNPGDDPSMEIVTAIRTTHPLVYQIVTRGEEDTAIVAHPVGCYVGLHYTAGVSNADFETILSILESDIGSIIYSWIDVFGNKKIGILPPAAHGKVLVTAGSSKRPFWDWVWGAPGAGGGFIITRESVIEVGYLDEKISPTLENKVVVVECSYNTDAEKFECEIVVIGEYEYLLFDGSSGSELFENNESEINSEAYLISGISDPAPGNTGGGSVTGVGISVDGVAEIWTLTCTAGGATGTFSVTGSVSGAKAPATVGTPYDNGIVVFIINDGTPDFVIGDNFQFTVIKLN